MDGRLSRRSFLRAAGATAMAVGGWLFATWPRPIGEATPIGDQVDSTDAAAGPELDGLPPAADDLRPDPLAQPSAVYSGPPEPLAPARLETSESPQPATAEAVAAAGDPELDEDPMAGDRASDQTAASTEPPAEAATPAAAGAPPSRDIGMRVSDPALMHFARALGASRV